MGKCKAVRSHTCKAQILDFLPARRQVLPWWQEIPVFVIYDSAIYWSFRAGIQEKQKLHREGHTHRYVSWHIRFHWSELRLTFRLFRVFFRFNSDRTSLNTRYLFCMSRPDPVFSSIVQVYYQFSKFSVASGRFISMGFLFPQHFHDAFDIIKCIVFGGIGVSNFWPDVLCIVQ